jgi:uncharacterized membrane protein
MEIARFWRHVAMTPGRARRSFPDTAMDAIQQEITAQERRHRGEVVFVVEAELSSAELWRGVSSRERGREVFAMQGVWNTEENNGVLIYVLLADHRVEIVADRGIDARVDAGQWRAICEAIDDAFREGRYLEGALAGVRAVSGLLALHFPATDSARNELGDRPIRL